MPMELANLAQQRYILAQNRGWGKLSSGAVARVPGGDGGRGDPRLTWPFRKTTLDNGLRVVSCEIPHSRSVSISIFIGVGSRYEPAGAGRDLSLHRASHVQGHPPQARTRRDQRRNREHRRRAERRHRAGVHRLLVQGRGSLRGAGSRSDAGHDPPFAMRHRERREGADGGAGRAEDEHGLSQQQGGRSYGRDALAGPPAGTRHRRDRGVRLRHQPRDGPGAHGEGFTAPATRSSP